jgi:hypothetical protein
VERGRKRTRRQECAGNEETGLFDMVNKRRRGPMHRQDAGAPSRQRQRARVPAERARRRAFFCARCRFARESRDPGATRRAASVTLLGPRKSGLPDLRAFECRSRASPRSVSRGVYPRAAQSADPGARPGHASGACPRGRLLADGAGVPRPAHCVGRAQSLHRRAVVAIARAGEPCARNCRISSTRSSSRSGC